MIRRLIALMILVAFTSTAAAENSAVETTPMTELPVCGTEPISIARMQWPSAAILAAIHADILSAELGCTIDIVGGDLNATTSSMAMTGRPMVAPEIWLGRVASIWNAALETGRVRQAAPTFSGGDLEAWFVPDYVAKDNPGLKSATDLMDHWQVFANGGTRASFLSCPSDWACAVINRNLVRAFGLTTRFDIIEPENRFKMDKTIAGAVSRHEPILFYYWQPNGVLAQFGFTELDMGAYDAKAVSCLASTDCVVPSPSSFPSEQVVIVISDDLFALAPAVAAYFQRATMPFEEMNRLLAEMSESGGTPEDAALSFVENRPEIWTAWLGR